MDVNDFVLRKARQFVEEVDGEDWENMADDHQDEIIDFLGDLIIEAKQANLLK